MTVKKLAIVIVVGAAVLTAAAADGVFDPSAVGYWRSRGQTTLLWLANAMPAGDLGQAVQLRAVPAAVRVHPSGVTTDELAAIAALLERSREAKAAARVWLAVARARQTAGDVAKARASSERALAAHRSIDALVALVVLHHGDSALSAKWLRELAAAAPGHDLVVVSRCLREFDSFAGQVPSMCTAVDWVLPYVRTGYTEHRRITQEIEALPGKATAEIAKEQNDIVRRTEHQRELATKYQTVAAEKNGLGGSAIVEFIVDALPLPKEGDTFAQWAVREGLCATRALNPLCLAASAGGAYTRMKEREASIDQRLQEIADWHRLDADLIAISERHIAEWQSDRPLRTLERERDALGPAFTREVEGELSNRHAVVGLEKNRVLRDVAALR